MLSCVNETHRESAELIRSLITQAQVTPEHFRAALTSVPPPHRDDWLDLVFELDSVPADGPQLPRECVPYLPCAVDALLRLVDRADIRGHDVFVDVGSGVGRAAAVVHLLTGAPAIGVEIQPDLVLASKALSERLNVPRLSLVQGDAAVLTGCIMIGSVFFMYCPFSGERLERVLASLQEIARTRPIRVCCVDLPLPPCSWLQLLTPRESESDLAVYRSTLFDER